MLFIEQGGVVGFIGKSPGPRNCVILVLYECTWNALMALLVFPSFNDTGLPGYPPRRLVYRPSVSTLVTASRLLAGKGEGELKPTSFSSFLLFRVLLSFSFSYLPSPSDIAS